MCIRDSRAYSLFYVVGTLGATRVPVIGMTPLRSLEQIAPLLVFFGLQLLAATELVVKAKRAKAELSRADAWKTVWKSNLQPDFNVSVCDSFDASSLAVLRELDESNRFVQKSAESTSI